MKTSIAFRCCVWSLMLLGMLAACDGDKGPFDVHATKAQLSQIKTIAVVRSPEPSQYTVYLQNDLLGKTQDQLTSAFKAHGAATAAHLSDELAEQLRMAGYQTRVVDADWESVGGRYRLPSNKMPAADDGVLFVELHAAGFWKTGRTAGFVPRMNLDVTLVGRNRGRPIFRHAYLLSGGPAIARGRGSYGRWVPSRPSKTFESVDELLADPSTAAQMLDAGGSAVARAIVVRLVQVSEGEEDQ